MTLQCAICGKFVPYDPLVTKVELITPDSAYSAEEWDVVHRACEAKEAKP